MKEFKVRTQSSRTGNVSPPRSCRWIMVYLDPQPDYLVSHNDTDEKIEIDTNKNGTQIRFFSDEDWISIDLDDLKTFLRIKDEELSNLFHSFKRIKYGTD